MPSLYILSPTDRMVYQDVFPEKSMQAGKQMVIAQLVVNASLDMVDEVMWSNNQMFLKVVDRFNEQSISAYVTAGNFRFILMHDSRTDNRAEEGIKQFFTELYEMFVKITMNPLHDDNESIVNKTFRERVNQLARKYLIF